MPRSRSRNSNYSDPAYPPAPVPGGVWLWSESAQTWTLGSTADEIVTTAAAVIVTSETRAAAAVVLVVATAATAEVTATAAQCQACRLAQ